MGKILIDYNQLILANVHIGLGTFGDSVNHDMIRHLFLSNLLTIKKKFGKEHKDVIICCDGANTWRRDKFPYYKYKRQQSRADSPLDWKMIFESMDLLKQELSDFFPYPVINVEGAEGDDVIATMVKYYQENELVQDGLEISSQPIMIISSDKDFVQLQRYPNVRQYSSIQKLFVKHPDPKAYLVEHIIRAGDDGIPNIYSDDDVFVVGKRQTVMTQNRFKEALDQIMSGEISPQLKDNFLRNKMLIDLINEIPAEINDRILAKYEEQNHKDRSKLLSYFMTNKLRNLMPEITNF